MQTKHIIYEVTHQYLRWPEELFDNAHTHTQLYCFYSQSKSFDNQEHIQQLFHTFPAPPPWFLFLRTIWDNDTKFLDCLCCFPKLEPEHLKQNPRTLNTAYVFERKSRSIFFKCLKILKKKKNQSSLTSLLLNSIFY